MCTPCPLNSKSYKTGSSVCSCLKGYYRHRSDGKHMPCYKLPPAPINLTLIYFDQTSAILTWDQLNRTSNSNDPQPSANFFSNIVYKVKCPTCPSNVVFNPSTETFLDTKITITNLEPVTTYTVQIHSMNSISIPIDGGINNSFNNINNTLNRTSDNVLATSTTTSGTINDYDTNNTDYFDDTKTEYAEIVFTTGSAILSTVFNIKIVSITNTEAELIWEKPQPTESPIEYYEVRWFPKTDMDALNKTTLSTKETKIHIYDLMENTEYGFQIRCKTNLGWGTYSNIVYAQTHQSVSAFYDDSIQMSIIAIIAVAVVFTLVLGISIVFFLHNIP